MPVTASSTGEIAIHVNSGGTSTGGGQLIVQDREGASTFSDLLRVRDTGRVTVRGVFIIDNTIPYRVKNTDSSATITARFKTGPSETTLLEVQPDGRTVFNLGELVLRVGTQPYSFANQEGEVHWFQSGTDWYLRVYWDGAWSDLAATAC